jgi:hypothetical protein
VSGELDEVAAAVVFFTGEALARDPPAAELPALPPTGRPKKSTSERLFDDIARREWSRGASQMSEAYVNLLPAAALTEQRKGRERACLS